jgi:hypothetical protein
MASIGARCARWTRRGYGIDTVTAIITKPTIITIFPANISPCSANPGIAI